MLAEEVAPSHRTGAGTAAVRLANLADAALLPLLGEAQLVRAVQLGQGTWAAHGMEVQAAPGMLPWPALAAWVQRPGAAARPAAEVCRALWEVMDNACVDPGPPHANGRSTMLMRHDDCSIPTLAALENGLVNISTPDSAID